MRITLHLDVMTKLCGRMHAGWSSSGTALAHVGLLQSGARLQLQLLVASQL